MVKKARAQGNEKDSIDRHQESTRSSPTAFVTFSSQRAAQIASQVLLYTTHNPYSMAIRLAPAPQDIIWSALSMHPLRRSIQSAIVAILATVLTFFWTVPASFVASLTNLDSVAKVPTLAPAIAIVSQNERVYFLLKTIGPPVVVNIFNLFIPYMLECTIYFAAGYLIYKNQLLYVYVKEYESYGRHWVMGFKRIIIGLIIFQVTMGGIFVTKRALFERRTKHISLDQLLDKNVSSPTTGKPRKRPTDGSQDSVDPDVNPIFSKPLSRPWLPVSIAGWWSLLPRYDSEGDLGDESKMEESDDEHGPVKSVKMEEITMEEGGGSNSKALPKVTARLRSATRGRRGTLSKGVLVVAVKGEGNALQGQEVVTGWTDADTDIKLSSDIISPPNNGPEE
ncbi:hypothetical protein BC829DRAFT_441663 [Chytridium lagenaria]|nr:hypothetical protein BC829DRAFT_441663 [Chytridium lagenaria]